jgi:hypothetical protein
MAGPASSDAAAPPAAGGAPPPLAAVVPGLSWYVAHAAAVYWLVRWAARVVGVSLFAVGAAKLSGAFGPMPVFTGEDDPEEGPGVARGAAVLLLILGVNVFVQSFPVKRPQALRPEELLRTAGGGGGAAGSAAGGGAGVKED